MLQIKGPQTPASTEKELASLLSSGSKFLQLPVHPQKWWLGGESGLVQIAMTWARTRDNPILVTYVQRDDDPTTQLESMAKRLFGFVALLMADEIVDLADGIAMRDGVQTSPRRTLRPAAYDQCRHVAEMMFQPVAKFALGSKVFLVSVDHSSMWAIPWLYGPNKSVLDRIAFTTLADELITKATISAGGMGIDRTCIPRIGAILHELFKNTHEWARADANGVPWRRSLRGLTIERHSWSNDECVDLVQDNPALRNFLDSFSEHKGLGRHRFLELTVFDGGIGLARQWLGASWRSDLSLQDEYAACTKCLRKHHSSSSNRDRGLGLAEVMVTLNSLRGFIRVRTGRLSLYRDFSSVPLRSAEDVALYDFSTTSENMTQLAQVYGTHYQMLIPLLHQEE